MACVFNVLLVCIRLLGRLVEYYRGFFFGFLRLMLVDVVVFFLFLNMFFRFFFIDLMLVNLY